MPSNLFSSNYFVLLNLKSLMISEKKKLATKLERGGKALVTGPLKK